MVTIAEIAEFLKIADNVELFDKNAISEPIVHAAPINEAGAGDISFLTPNAKRASKVLAATHASLLIVGEKTALDRDILTRNGVKAAIRSLFPRLDFARIVQKSFTPPLPSGIHQSAIIDPAARIHPNVYIGPFTYVGKCFIDEGSVIYGHVHIYGNTRIGRNVIIHAGTVIGADGFGYAKSDDGTWTKFPHLGGVVIEDHVEIGANACIDRGALSDTVVRQGAKLDNLVHIAHNVVIGRNAMVIANAMIAGSTQVGDNAWIAPSAALIEKISIGENAKVGIGAVVIRDVKGGQTVMGEPARTIVE